MAKILLIDSNPEQQKALSGLIRYRTPYSVVTTETCVEGARAVVAERPDLVMINALMFMASSFAFSRALQQNDQTGAIPIVVHTSGALGELSQRRIEVRGVAGIVEMPVGAGELTHEIEEALKKGEAQKPREAQAVKWPQAADRDSQTPEVRPVDWQAVAAQSKPRPPAAPSRARSAEPPPPPASQPHTGSDAGQTAEKTGFRANMFEAVEPPDEAKNADREETSDFQGVRWPSADPRRVKNRPGRK